MARSGAFSFRNVFLNAGDPLMIEKPLILGPSRLFHRFSQNSVRLIGADGISLADFERLAKHSGARLVLRDPEFPEPIRISYSLEKRDKLAGLLRKYEVVMIEDDPYGEIRFSGEPVPPVYSHLPKQVIWSGSFSKMISPGIRMGWLCVPNPLLKYFTRSKEAMDLHSNNLLQAAILQFLTDNDIDELW
jgi:2-aminoadipate transaminase